MSLVRKVPTTWLHRVTAACCAVVAFCAVLAIIAAVVPWLLTLLYGWGHPGDASAGDSAGWALVILSPILLPVAFVAAVIGAVAAYVGTMRKLGA